MLCCACHPQEFELGLAFTAEAASTAAAAGPATPRAGDEAALACAGPLLDGLGAEVAAALRARRGALALLLGASLGEAFVVRGGVGTNVRPFVGC